MISAGDDARSSDTASMYSAYTSWLAGSDSSNVTPLEDPNPSKVPSSDGCGWRPPRSAWSSYFPTRSNLRSTARSILNHPVYTACSTVLTIPLTIARSAYSYYSNYSNYSKSPDEECRLLGGTHWAGLEKRSDVPVLDSQGNERYSTAGFLEGLNFGDGLSKPDTGTFL